MQEQNWTGLRGARVLFGVTECKRMSDFQSQKVTITNGGKLPEHSLQKQLF